MMLLGAGTVKDLGHKHIVRSTIPPPNLWILLIYSSYFYLLTFFIEFYVNFIM